MESRLTFYTVHNCTCCPLQTKRRKPLCSYSEHTTLIRIHFHLMQKDPIKLILKLF